MNIAPPLGIMGTQATVLCDWSTTVGGYRFAFRAGYQSDGLSAPLLARPWYPRFDDAKYRRPWLIHDGWYAAQIGPRPIGDALFLLAMVESGCADAKSLGAYMAVRAGGKRLWRRHTDAQIIEARKYVTITKL